MNNDDNPAVVIVVLVLVLVVVVVLMMVLILMVMVLVVSTYLRCFSCWQLWQAGLVTSTGTNISSKIKDDKRSKTSRYDFEL